MIAPLLWLNARENKNLNKKILSLCLVIALPFWQIVSAQSFSWANQLGGLGGIGNGQSISAGSSGSVISMGIYSGTMDFDPGVGSDIHTAAGNDIFVIQFDTSGNFLRGLSFGGTGNDISIALFYDDAGNTILAGSFVGVGDFDPGAGVHYLTSNGSSSMFVLKLDAALNYVWAKSINGTGYTDPRSVTVDAVGDIYMTGIFYGTSDFDPGPGIFNLTPTVNGNDAFVAKLDAAGNFGWAKRIGGTQYDIGSDIQLDGSGNVIAAGYFGNTIDFDPGAGVYNVTAVGFLDSYLLKLSPQGNFIWVRTFGGLSSDCLRTISLDTSGNIYCGGIFSSTIDLDPGPASFTLTAFGLDDVFISKLDSGGNFVWGKQFGGVGYEYIYGIEADESGAVYATGTFRDLADFDPDSGIVNLISAGLDDSFVLSLHPTGALNWLVGLGSDSSDIAHGIAVVGSESVYVNGLFQENVDFDPGASTFNLSTIGNMDGFVLKLGNCISSQSAISVTSCTAYTSMSGHYTWTTTGIYRDTIPNAIGCDSIIAINLTILNHSDSTVLVSACDHYLSPSGHFNWTSSGMYIDTLTNVLGCDSILTINLTINSVDTSIIFSAPTLTANAMPAVYQWIYCDSVQILGATNQNFTPTTNGGYAVIVTENGCIDTSACETVIVVSTEELNLDCEIFPNPTIGKVCVSSMGEDAMAIKVSNVFGQVTQYDLVDGFDYYELEINGPAGTYFLEIRLKDGRMGCFRVIKQ